MSVCDRAQRQPLERHHVSRRDQSGDGAAPDRRLCQKPHPVRLPLIFNLRRDPYERAQLTSNTYYDWLIDRAFMLVPAQSYVAEFLPTFVEYPPRQTAASFSLDDVMEQLTTAGGSK